MSDFQRKSSMENYRRDLALSRWPEETLQRHPQSLSEGFRHTNGVLGTDCTGAIKVARSHQERRERKRICKAKRKRRERKAKTNGPPADSMTLTCSTCNHQFKARSGLVRHQRTHRMNPIYEIMIVETNDHLRLWQDSTAWSSSVNCLVRHLHTEECLVCFSVVQP